MADILTQAEIEEFLTRDDNESIPERNRRIIEEVWDGKHPSEDWCGTCKFLGEDEHYLRICKHHNFSSYAMKITNCISYKEKERKND